MKNLIRTALTLMLCLVVCSFLSPTALAETIASGTSGDNLNWTLDNEGTLFISGYGDMTSSDGWSEHINEQGVAETAQETAEQAKDDAEATAESVSQSAAQIETNKQDIDDLKSALDEAIEDFAVPTQEAVDNWLGRHPEATTTVQDGSLTEAKFDESLKLKTIKAYVTPEMFGAKGDGVTDDSYAFQAAYDSVKATGGLIILPGERYYLGEGITGINHTGRKSVVFKGIKLPQIIVASNITVFTVGDSDWITDLSDGYGNFELENIYFKCPDKTSILIDNSAMRHIAVIGCRIENFLIGVRTTGSWGGSKYNSTFHLCDIGVEVLDRCNFAQFFRGGFLACRIGIHFNNPTYEVTTNSVVECDFEGNTYGILVDSIGSFNNLSVERCNFESSTNAIIISNALGSSNKSSISIVNNNFYHSGYIKIGTDASGSNIIGVRFIGNTISTDTDNTVLLGSECPTKISNLVSNANSTFGTASTTLVYPQNVPELSLSGGTMVRYPLKPADPWGSEDPGGVQGDIRYSGNYMFFKTDTGWKRAVLNDSWSRNDGEKYAKENKMQIVTYTPSEPIASGEKISYFISINIPSGYSVGGVTLLCDSGDVIDFRLLGINETNQTIKIEVFNNHSVALTPSVQARIIYIPN